MSDNEKKFQQLDLELQKTKKLPHFLRTDYNCVNDDSGNLEVVVQKMKSIRSDLLASVELYEKNTKSAEKMSNNLKDNETKLTDAMNELLQIGRFGQIDTSGISKLQEEFPEFSE